MSGCDVDVRPAQLRQRGGQVRALAPPCRQSAAAMAFSPLTPQAFGATTHAPLLVRMAGEFRRALQERLAQEAEHLEHYAAALEQAAATYESCDARSAAGYDRLRTREEPPAGEGSMPVRGVHPVRPVP